MSWCWTAVHAGPAANRRARGDEVLDAPLDVDPVATADRYRALYPELGIPPITPLPGAAEAFEAVHALGGRVLVVSAKVEPAVQRVLTHVGLDAGARAPDLVVGGLFAAAKGVRLAAEGADVYVGDHLGDVEAAQVAGATSVAVATGPHPEAALAAAGADVVRPDLTGFAAWLRAWDESGQPRCETSCNRPIAFSGTTGCRWVQPARICVIEGGTCQQAR